jgi:hypothetical protein
VEEDSSGGKQLFSGRVRYSMERENNDDDMRRSISFEGNCLFSFLKLANLPKSRM